MRFLLVLAQALLAPRPMAVMPYAHEVPDAAVRLPPVTLLWELADRYHPEQTWLVVLCTRGERSLEEVARTAAPERLAPGLIEAARRSFGVGRLIVFRAGQAASIEAADRARLVLIGGAPVDGERHIWWNFVSNSPEPLERAKADWRDRRLGRSRATTRSVDPAAGALRPPATATKPAGGSLGRRRRGDWSLVMARPVDFRSPLASIGMDETMRLWCSP